MADTEKTSNALSLLGKALKDAGLAIDLLVDPCKTQQETENLGYDIKTEVVGPGITFTTSTPRKADEQEEKPWPQMGEIYYHIGADSVVNYDRWENSPWDRNAKKQGIHKTEKEAEQIAKNRKVHTMLKELAGGVEPDWESASEDKYAIFWNCEQEEHEIHTFYELKMPNAVYFRTGDECYKAIQAVTEKHGQDAIKKYCLYGVI